MDTQYQQQNGSLTYCPPPPTDGRCALLQLPGEVLSQIASYLPLSDLLRFLLLHPLLLQLTKTHLSPLPLSIRQSISSGPPYPDALATLPHLYTLLPPDRADQGRLFLPVLVQARPKWILERFEFARWTEGVWQEAFERRYLASWKRYKGEEDTWRATFLRLLGRLEHRNLGCTHEESWTRFVTLHRNGSASINRIYSRLFDPYEIFDELKHQNNFASQPTQIRVLVHLQDVRVIAVGVLLDQPSLFVNPNAHLALHPPLLRSVSTAIDDYDYLPPSRSTRLAAIQADGQNGQAESSQLPQTRAAYGLNMAPVPVSPTQPTNIGSPTIRSTLANFIPGRRRTSSVAQAAAADNEGADGHDGNALTRVISPNLPSSLGRLSMLSPVRSRESDDGLGGRRRTWSFGRTGSTSAVPSVSLASAASAASAGSGLPAGRVQGAQRSQAVQSLPVSQATPSSITPHDTARLSDDSGGSSQSDPLPNKLQEIPESTPRGTTTPASPSQSPPPALPYPVMRKPQPAPSHALYPNFTPATSSPSTAVADGSSSRQEPHDCPRGPSNDGVVQTRDLRTDHQEMEDEFEGGLWARDDHHITNAGGGNDIWGEGGRMAEWGFDKNGRAGRKRWVGPMLIIAQLHPCTRTQPNPPGSDPPSSSTSATGSSIHGNGLEGAHPDLGPKGMYASLGFEDIEAFFPWIKLRGSGANSWEAKRGGLGFE